MNRGRPRAISHACQLHFRDAIDIYVYESFFPCFIASENVGQNGSVNMLCSRQCKKRTDALSL